MTIMPLGDYFVWYCDWCDSTNHFHWSRLNREELTCAACSRPRSDADSELHGLLPCAA